MLRLTTPCRCKLFGSMNIWTFDMVTTPREGRRAGRRYINGQMVKLNTIGLWQFGIYSWVKNLRLFYVGVMGFNDGQWENFPEN